MSETTPTPAGEATALLRTPLYETHVAAGGKMVPFGGWEMPLHYGSILTEHHTVRKGAGIFDVSHMGRLWFDGPDNTRLLAKVLTRNVHKLADGRSGYTLICNESGGVIDDAIATRFGPRWFMVVNASNRPNVLPHLSRQSAGLDVKVHDATSETAMLAVQGPGAAAVASRILGHDLGKQKYYSGAAVTYRGQPAWLFRSGYTGEDGFEIVVPASLGPAFWADAVDKASGSPAVPAGLGARDTLRLEAGMPLYGHEYTLSTDGISAQMDWVIDLAEGGFVGAEAMRKIKAAGPARKLVGLVLHGRKQARQGYPVFDSDGGRPVGEVTSGAASPTLEKVIAMAYVDSALAEPGSSVTVGIRDEKIPATVVKLPFYKRQK
jgi:aminomethyltransferase